VEIKESIAQLASLKTYTLELEHKFKQMKQEPSLVKSRLMLAQDEELGYSTTQQPSLDTKNTCGCAHALTAEQIANLVEIAANAGRSQHNKPKQKNSNNRPRHNQYNKTHQSNEAKTLWTPPISVRVLSAGLVWPWHQVTARSKRDGGKDPLRDPRQRNGKQDLRQTPHPEHRERDPHQDGTIDPAQNRHLYVRNTVPAQDRHLDDRNTDPAQDHHLDDRNRNPAQDRHLNDRNTHPHNQPRQHVDYSPSLMDQIEKVTSSTTQNLLIQEHDANANPQSFLEQRPQQNRKNKSCQRNNKARLCKL
jgi:hypothetical protein